MNVSKKHGVGGETKDISNQTQLVSEIYLLQTGKQHCFHFQDEDTEAYRIRMFGTDHTQVHTETQQ